MLIVGAGQSGLQLALGLQAQGREITLVTNRSAADIRGGRVLSTQAMFHTSLQIERDLGLNAWEEETPRIAGLGISVAAPEGLDPAIDFLGTLDGYAQSVDQRMKFAGWLETFEERGGRVLVQHADLDTLDRLSAGHDLVIAATGRGDLGRLFPVDPSRSPYGEPQRALAVAYVHGGRLRDGDGGRPAIHCNLLPGAGELFAIPARTLSGPCDILFIEAVPGGPLDVFGDVRDPDRFLELMLEKVRQFAPWEYDRFKDAELTDEQAFLSGRVTPAVRRAAAELPSGVPVLGAADAVVSNDPITGQGAGAAARCGAHYLHALVQRGDRPYDQAFLQGVFDRYWTEHAQHVTKWSNGLLMPPPEHIVKLFAAAERLEPVADRIANAFDDPSDLEEFWYQPKDVDEYLGKVRASLGISQAR
ncbi:oxygenase [Mangrovactinospora gilvigrisea]|uniref:Oxygenase n=1 Tax=Mangrovactinospora gilvigrisea TaxID=1428644 RepID=A0A1J7BBK0_9ACTN|nr:styrene monooxygenase/indole monooxygenase family protein [Mangrovactinospora gilvigrisea]OIV36006.1 oxygenase [Mangrovactinospora gilvigrisea]